MLGNAGTTEEAALMRAMAAARRAFSAKERLARLRRETKLPPVATLRPSGKHRLSTKRP